MQYENTSTCTEHATDLLPDAAGWTINFCSAGKFLTVDVRAACVSCNFMLNPTWLLVHAHVHVLYFS